jgi:hypothetical protein
VPTKKIVRRVSWVSTSIWDSTYLYRFAFKLFDSLSYSTVTVPDKVEKVLSCRSYENTPQIEESAFLAYLEIDRGPMKLYSIAVMYLCITVVTIR